ncbi:hypothetical protein FWK35_00031081 [Aphis craccivora]|uniref:Uncharacterized protein n=1 Tax=Aphis craccivora TaxID=307492 RepID=A0A6G0YY45_APHCR|nr:hypothetical protein FWK35_00031081 [Aphis craccivora]
MYLFFFLYKMYCFLNLVNFLKIPMYFLLDTSNHIHWNINLNFVYKQHPIIHLKML